MFLSGSGWTRSHIPIYGYWLTSGRGILTLAHVVSGDVEKNAERRERHEKALRVFIAKEQLEAFPVVTCNEFLSDGIESLIQCHGIGGLRPNTVLLGWPRDDSKAESFGASLRVIARMKRSILAARFLAYRDTEDEAMDDFTNVDGHWQVPRGTIDVWWRGKDNGALMLLLAHLLHCNGEWRNNKIRMLRIVDNEQARPDVEAHIAELGAAARISIQPEVIVSREPTEVVIQRASAGASLVFFGIQTPQAGQELELYRRMELIAGDLPRVLFVASAGGMALES